MMAIWHAYANDMLLVQGSVLLVTGGEEPVNMEPGTEIGIDLSNGSQTSARIVLHEGDRLIVSMPTVGQVELHRVPDGAGFQDFKLTDGFSRQTWIVQ